MRPTDADRRPAAAFGAVAAVMPASVLNADLPPAGRVLTVSHVSDQRPVHFHMPTGLAEVVAPMLEGRGLGVVSRPYVDVDDHSLDDEYFDLLEAEA